jgi:hypothetical protein
MTTLVVGAQQRLPQGGLANASRSGSRCARLFRADPRYAHSFPRTKLFIDALHGGRAFAQATQRSRVVPLEMVAESASRVAIEAEPFTKGPRRVALVRRDVDATGRIDDVLDAIDRRGFAGSNRLDPTDCWVNPTANASFGVFD